MESVIIFLIGIANVLSQLNDTESTKNLGKNNRLSNNYEQDKIFDKLQESAVNSLYTQEYENLYNIALTENHYINNETVDSNIERSSIYNKYNPVHNSINHIFNYIPANKDITEKSKPKNAVRLIIANKHPFKNKNLVSHTKPQIDKSRGQNNTRETKPKTRVFNVKRKENTNRRKRQLSEEIYNDLEEAKNDIEGLEKEMRERGANKTKKQNGETPNENKVNSEKDNNSNFTPQINQTARRGKYVIDVDKCPTPLIAVTIGRQKFCLPPESAGD